MSGLRQVTANIAQRLRESKEREAPVATSIEYNTWLWGLGPEKVQELLDVKETKIIHFEGMDFELPKDGVVAAWGRHCKRMGWQDRAFSGEGIEGELEKKLMRSIDYGQPETGTSKARKVAGRAGDGADETGGQ